MLVDPETGELRPVSVAAGAAGTVAQRARPMLVQDAGLFPDFASHRGLQTGIKTGSAIAVRIEIEDEGCGIKPEHLNRVLEPFFSTRGVGQGMGLGLTAAYGVAQRSGGKIEARSEPGRGATFTVTLVAGRLAPERDLTLDRDQALEAAAAG